MVPLLLFAVFILVATFIPQTDSIQTCREYLQALGYETGETVESETVTLPETADATWEAYLQLQKECGFDMEKYAGKTVLKLTFCILNYPSADTVYANLYLWEGVILGGDIMTPALDGFMHGLTVRPIVT